MILGSPLEMRAIQMILNLNLFNSLYNGCVCFISQTLLCFKRKQRRRTLVLFLFSVSTVPFLFFHPFVEAANQRNPKPCNSHINTLNTIHSWVVYQSSFSLQWGAIATNWAAIMIICVGAFMTTKRKRFLVPISRCCSQSSWCNKISQQSTLMIAH